MTSLILAVVWAGVFGLLAVSGADVAREVSAAWRGLAPATAPMPPAGLAGGIALGAAYAAAVALAYGWALVAATLFGLTWLALPRRGRRTLPAVAVVWAASVAGECLRLVPPWRPAPALDAALWLGTFLASAEVLRAVLTTIAREVAAAERVARGVLYGDEEPLARFVAAQERATVTARLNAVYAAAPDDPAERAWRARAAASTLRATTPEPDASAGW